jgi:hypothetical protein
MPVAERRRVLDKGISDDRQRNQKASDFFATPKLDGRADDNPVMARLSH